MDMAKELLAILPDLLLRETGNPNLFVTNEVGSYASLTTVLLQEVLFHVFGLNLNSFLYRLRSLTSY